MSFLSIVLPVNEDVGILGLVSKIRWDGGGHEKEEEGKLEENVETYTWRSRWRRDDKTDKEMGGTRKLAPLV